MLPIHHDRHNLLNRNSYLLKNFPELKLKELLMMMNTITSGLCHKETKELAPI